MIRPTQDTQFPDPDARYSRPCVRGNLQLSRREFPWFVFKGMRTVQIISPPLLLEVSRSPRPARPAYSPVSPYVSERKIPDEFTAYLYRYASPCSLCCSLWCDYYDLCCFVTLNCVLSRTNHDRTERNTVMSAWGSSAQTLT